MAKAQQYEWSDGARRAGFGKCNVKDARVYLKALSDAGDLTKERVRADAAAPDHPLHGNKQWCWDDPEAAYDKWQLQIASSALTGVVVVEVAKVDGVDQTIKRPAFIQTGKLDTRGHGTENMTFEDVMADPLLRAEYLTRLLKDVRRLDQLYASVLALYPPIQKRWADLRKSIEAQIPPDM